MSDGTDVDTATQPSQEMLDIAKKRAEAVLAQAERWPEPMDKPLAIGMRCYITGVMDAAKVTQPASESVWFCPMCFADSNGGSWNGGVDEHFCTNCSASGTGILVPAWAVKSIRAQASWVGKRYYPNDEDREAWAERRLLRASVAELSRLTVARCEYDNGDPKRWSAKVVTNAGSMTSTSFDAGLTIDEATAKAKVSLPFVPAGGYLYAVIANGKRAYVGESVWFRGSPELGDQTVERAEVASIDDDGLHFGGPQRVKWMCAELCYATSEEALSTPRPPKPRAGRGRK